MHTRTHAHTHACTPLNSYHCNAKTPHVSTYGVALSWSGGVNTLGLQQGGREGGTPTQPHPACTSPHSTPPTTSTYSHVRPTANFFCFCDGINKLSCQSEVTQFDGSTAVHHHIGWLDVYEREGEGERGEGEGRERGEGEGGEGGERGEARPLSRNVVTGVGVGWVHP